MKRFILVFSLIFIVSFLFAQPTDRNLSLGDSVKLALLNNRKLLIAQEEIDIIKDKTNEALAFRYTQVDLTTNYSHYKLDNPYYSLPDAMGNSLLSRDYENFHMIRLSLNQLLYSGRRMKNTKKASNISLKKVDSDYKKIKNEVMFETNINFYKYLFFKLKTDFFKESQDYLTGLKDIHTAFKDTDKDDIRYLDMFSFKIYSKLEDALLKRDEARLDFLSSIGVELNSMTDIKGRLEPISLEDIDLERAIAKALQLRPELIASEAREEMGFLELNISLSERNPVIALGGSYQYSSDILSFNDKFWRSDWHVGLSMHIPLFDGGAWFARNSQRKNNLRKIKIQKAEIEESIKLEVKKAFLRYEYAKRKFDRATVLFKKAKEFVLDHDLSMVSAVDLKEIFDNKRNEIETTVYYWDSILEYNLSVIYLLYVIGDL